MKERQQPKLRCYVCGKGIKDDFFLATEADIPTDRVFLVCDKDNHSCHKTLDENVRTIKVIKNDMRFLFS